MNEQELNEQKRQKHYREIELNPCNYPHDEIIRLNGATIEEIIESVLD